MMKKLLILCLFASLLFSFTTEKMVQIKGQVIDESTHNPLGFATVTLLDAATKNLVTGVSTDESGLFKLKVPTGTYDIKIEYLAFKSYVIENKTIEADFDMKTISLAPDITQLEGVEVIGERTTVEYKLDKKVFNVGKDLVSKGGTVSDVLDNVPSVSVDAGGTISLRGNPNVRILINGKPSVLAANNGLEQLTADMVEKVEVITNPSARYEASGTAGIINIVLRKNKTDGFGSSIQLTGGIPANHTANINANYKTEQFNLFTNVGYRYANFFAEATNRQSVVREGVTRILEQEGDQKRNDDHYNFYVGGDYFFNEKNTLTASYYYNRLNNTDRTNLSYVYKNIDGEVDSLFTQVENYREPQRFNELEIDYVKTFDKKGKKFTTSIVYDFWNDDENEELLQQYELPFSAAPRTIKTRDVESSKDLLVQTDYVSPVGEEGRLELGLRGEIRRITSDYTATVNEEVLSAFDNLMIYNERIYGAYVQYGNKVKKFNYLLGLRTEVSDIGIKDREERFSDDKLYAGLFPTAHLTYNFSDLLNIQLSYSRRINRPRFWQLNPFGGLSDPRNLFAGNPDLDPMYTNSYELGLLKRWEKVTLNPSLYFQQNTDFFQFITTINEDGNFLTFPVNLSHENRLGAEVSTTFTPTKWMRLSAEFNYFTFQQVGDYQGENFDTEDDAWSARINTNLRFKKGLTAQAAYRYRGQNQSGQTFTKDQHSLDFGIAKDVLKDQANIALNVRNILDSRIQAEIVTGENYRLESTSKHFGRRISATFTYRFNRKKNERERRPGQ